MHKLVWAEEKSLCKWQCGIVSTGDTRAGAGRIGCVKSAIRPRVVACRMFQESQLSYFDIPSVIMIAVGPL